MFKNKKAFTLIEMSVATLIVSILFAGTSVIFSKIRGIANENATEAKLDVIENALKAYFLENEDLPCPAGLKLNESDASFGTGAGTCAASSENGIYLSGTNLFYGAVPFKNLGIAPDFAYDGWGNKFSYIIDDRFTDATTFAQTDSTSKITINNTDGYEMTNKSIVLIISHGMNGLGAFGDKLQNTLPGVSDDEYSNVYISAFDSTFVNGFKTSTFDDVSRYFTKDEFARDMGIERIGCVEAEIPDWTYASGSYTIAWSDSSSTEGCTSGYCEYGTVVTAETACNDGNYPDHYFSPNPDTPYKPARKCLVNGTWSDAMYACEQGCGAGDGATTLLGVLDAISATDDAYTTAHLNSTTAPWKRVGLNKTITLTCVDSKTGTVQVTCQSDGSWAVYSGNCVDDSDYIDATDTTP